MHQPFDLSSHSVSDTSSTPFYFATVFGVILAIFPVIQARRIRNSYKENATKRSRTILYLILAAIVSLHVVEGAKAAVFGLKLRYKSEATVTSGVVLLGVYIVAFFINELGRFLLTAAILMRVNDLVDEGKHKWVIYGLAVGRVLFAIITAALVPVSLFGTYQAWQYGYDIAVFLISSILVQNHMAEVERERKADHLSRTVLYSNVSATQFLGLCAFASMALLAGLGATPDAVVAANLVPYVKLM